MNERIMKWRYADPMTLKDLKTYRIPCSWEYHVMVEVEAESWDEAISIAESGSLPFPDESSDDPTVRVDKEMVEYEKDSVLA